MQKLDIGIVRQARKLRRAGKSHREISKLLGIGLGLPKRNFYHHRQACRRSFGSWNNAVIAAGFGPEKGASSIQTRRSSKQIF